MINASENHKEEFSFINSLHDISVLLKLICGFERLVYAISKIVSHLDITRFRQCKPDFAENRTVTNFEEGNG